MSIIAVKQLKKKAIHRNKILCNSPLDYLWALGLTQGLVLVIAACTERCQTKILFVHIAIICKVDIKYSNSR